jgi:hypothetical protein
MSKFSVLSPDSRTEIITNVPLRVSKTRQNNGFQVTLPFNCFAMGGVEEDAGIVTTHINNFMVPGYLAGRGIGTRLMKGFIAESKKLGAMRMNTWAVHEAVVQIQTDLLGEAALKFYDILPESNVLCSVPMSTDQIVDSMVRSQPLIDAYYDEHNVFPCHEGFLVKADITSVDATDWELPIPTSKGYTQPPL